MLIIYVSLSTCKKECIVQNKRLRIVEGEKEKDDDSLETIHQLISSKSSNRKSYQQRKSDRESSSERG